MSSESLKDVEFFTRTAKQIAMDLQHEARLERIVTILERHLSHVWLDGFNEGFEQGGRPLEVVDERELSAIGDATGNP